MQPIPLNRETITLLERELPRTDVLSVTLSVNPSSSDNQGGALHIRAKNLLRSLEAPTELTSVVLADLSDARQTTRSRTYYLWTEHNHVKAHTIDAQLDLPEGAAFGAPDFETLHYALETNPATAIALVDHRAARLFGVQLGEITQVFKLDNVFERDNDNFQEHAPQTTLTDRLEPRADTFFWNALLGRMEQLRAAGNLERLLIAGPPEVRSSLTDALSTGLKSALAGTFHAPGDATPAQVLELAAPALRAAASDASDAAVEAVMNGGTRGVEETLSAVQEGRVFELLVSGDGSSLEVWQDSQGYVYGAYPAQGISPLTGSGVAGMPLREVLGALRTNFGVRVRFLHGDSDARLVGQLGGLAGLPRHG